MTTLPRVVYWNNIAAPYMVERFDALVARRNLDFEAWFSAPTGADRSWTVDERAWTFPYRYVPRAGVGGRQVTVPSGLVRRPRLDLVVSLYNEPPFLAGWCLARLAGIRTAFWVEVTFDSWVRRRWWKEALKRQVFPRLDGVITAGLDGRRFAERYGVPTERIHLVRHAIDVDHFVDGRRRWGPERNEVRSELGLAGTVYLYVGRLHRRQKGLDDLVSAFRRLQAEQGQPVSLLLVGDGPDEATLRSATRDLAGVVFAGFRQKPDLPRLYAAADVFVFPTLGDPYGLVVDEAMAAGLPVISTTAAGEIGERVLSETNGFLVPPGSPDRLLTAMQMLRDDGALRSRMGVQSSRLIAGHTPDRWAADFELAVEAILRTRSARCE